jgi:SAM-dependent methyltransferase
MDASIFYRCPRTGASLRSTRDFLECDQTRYLIIGGIPHFLQFDPVESVEDAAQMERLNERARQTNWRAALAEIYGADSGTYHYVTDSKRATWLDRLPMDSQTSVLEIGSSLGQITPLLAAQAKDVCALEVVSGQALFTAERCRQEGFQNVSVACGGDDCRLPYAADSFGLVVVNLVFEWCASRDSDEAPIEGQRRLLREMVRVLKPGGSIFLSTKNRYALRLLFGGRDEHNSNMRFGSALPRWFLNTLLRLKHKYPPPGMLHSYWQLRRMLKTSGLVEIQSYWAMPEMRFPIRVVSTDKRSIREARRSGVPQGDSKKTKFVMRWIPASLVKYVTAGLMFIARKPLE